MKESSNQVFSKISNGSDWWVIAGLARFSSMTGFGAMEDGQSLWIVPGRETNEFTLSIAGDDRPVPLLVATKAGVFKLTSRPAGDGPHVEITCEGADGEVRVISNQPSSLGVWLLTVAADGRLSAEHEVVV